MDTCRNLIRCYIPTRPSPLFSLRAHRSAVISILRFRTLSHSSQIDQLISWGGVVTPSIIGKGFWFKRWSRLLQSRIKIYLEENVSQEVLMAKGAFISPFDLLRRVNQTSLTEATNSFRRTATSLFLVFPKLHFDPSEVRGLEFQKRRLECHSPSKWGKYEIRCDGNGRDFASYIRNRSTRHKILTEYYKVFGPDFHESLLSLLKERKKFANQLGFASWTEMHAIANGYESEMFGNKLVENLYSELNLKPLITRFRKDKIVPTDNLDEQFALTQLRLASLPQNETALAMNKRESMFEYEKVLSRLFPLLGKLFRVKFEHVEKNLLLDGWHPDVKVFRFVRDNDGTQLGYIYLDLFRRISSGTAAGPHCSVLDPQNHIRVFMGFQPPYRSEITFRKERNFTFEEITALMHELGHCMHLLLRPSDSPVAQLPLDMKETISILTEMYCETDEFIDSVTDGKISSGERAAVKRNEFFYLDILRNVAVYEHIHSSQFDPETATVDDLVKVARQVYSNYSPFPLAECFNPLGGELVNYLMDGESRLGYLVAYMRAARLLTPVKAGTCTGVSVFNAVNKTFVQREFKPIVSGLLQSRIGDTNNPAGHPLSPFAKSEFDMTGNPAALWEFCSPLDMGSKSAKEKGTAKKPLISKM